MSATVLGPRQESQIPIDWIALGFWTSLLVPVVSYVVYPLGVVALSRRRPFRPIPESSPWPTVTIAIAAHDEEQTIERAVRSALAQQYPGEPPRVLVGLDGCTDATADVLAAMAEPRLDVLDLPRAGKASTDNRLVAAAGTEVVVTTSAGAEFAPGTLERLIEPLRDPAVGCTTGVFRPRSDGSETGDSEGLYWRIEYGVMNAESRLGVLAMASGTALAFRRSLFEPIPPASDADVVVAPRIVARGYRVVHVPDAIVYDDGPSSLSVVLRNRRRMTLRALPATVALIPRLVGSRRTGAALGLVVHKVLRWLTPLAGLIAALSGAILVLRGDVAHTWVVTIVISVVLGSVAVAIVRGPATRGALASLAVAQLAFALAILDVLRGHRAQTWTRGTS